MDNDNFYLTFSDSENKNLYNSFWVNVKINISDLSEWILRMRLEVV